MTDLVVCSLEAWDDVWRRNQLLVDGLLRRDDTLRVLFVEPSNDPAYDALSRRRPGRSRGLRVAEGYDGRLMLLQPTKWLPRSAGRFADDGLGRALARAARRCGMTAPLLWVNDPSWAPWVPRSGWPALYDITDDWLLADRSAQQRERLVDQERVLLECCREVVVCSPALQRSKSAVRPVVLIPNAVDVEAYARPAPRPADVGSEPYVVYVGTLHEDRLDVELVLRTAALLRDLAPGATLVLAGPNALSSASTAVLQRDPSISLLGARPYRDVPAYLQHAAVLIVPHVVDAFTGSLDPIKLYEYRAAGRPVVATPVAGFADLADHPSVTVASGDDFARQVARLVAEPSATSAPAEDLPTWRDRVEQMAGVLLRLDATRHDTPIEAAGRGQSTRDDPESRGGR